MKKHLKMSDFKNKHKGERCFFVLTGPSFKIDDVNLLKKEITFSVNSIIKLFHKTSWRPTYYCVTDWRYFNKNFKDYSDDTITFPFFYKKNAPFKHFKLKNAVPIKADHWKLLWSYFTRKHSIQNWSDDPSRKVIDWHSIVYPLMQIIVYMGFKDIYVIGADCDYTNGIHSKEVSYKGDHKIKASNSKNVLSSWEFIKYYMDSKKTFRIYNATRGGKLELFPRVRLEDVLAESR